MIHGKTLSFEISFMTMITKPFKVVVIDDQQADRDLLRFYLMPHSDMQLVAHAATACQGIQRIKTFLPHLVFLDIRLPDKDGFSMLDEINKLGINNFQLVFYSSSDNNHLKAIKYGAFDFLQKPLAEKDLVETLERFRKKFNNVSPTNNPEPEITPPPVESKKLVLTPTGHLYIDTLKIMFIHAEIKHCNVYMSDGEAVFTCYTLKSLLLHLDMPCLVKKHKSYAVNEGFVTGYSLDKKICFVSFENLNFQIPVSRRRRKDQK